jgi:AraC-like DNA-binding protein
MTEIHTDVLAPPKEAGFGEPSAFISVFRAAYGISPGRYLSDGGIISARR